MSGNETCKILVVHLYQLESGPSCYKLQTLYLYFFSLIKCYFLCFDKQKLAKYIEESVDNENATS